MGTSQPSNRIPAAIGVGIIVVIVLASILIAGRQIPTLDPSTPEGVAQSFVLARFDGDETAALDLMTDELAEQCRQGRGWWPRNGGRATIVETATTEHRAVVTLAISKVYGESPFVLSESTSRLTLVMVPSDTGWLISEEPSSWYWCKEGASR